jgi:hypothetical protein
MRLKNTLFISLVLVVCIISACKGNVTEKTMPDIGVPSNEMNSKLELLAPDGWNKFKSGFPITLAVKGISSDQILFNSDYGARLFIYKDNNWIEISNGEEYPEGSTILYPFENNYLRIAAVNLWPKLQDTTKPVSVRVILVGNVYRNGQMTDEVTAGYIDVNLKP